MAEALSARSALRQLNTSELAVPAVVLAIVLVMIVPVRPWMLDVLISATDGFRP